ncbi:processed acidic surface protein [Planococcus shixiaomingii]|uniref:processed acidic surface protein n=1 Tax=Planococcus shixiaomingii TaxID=3058393 RepID=UPI002604DF28|nr:processed acidic surface protein [Planococcus sp. N022]WKA53877.1 processed acidic surface protein [Planococcus sp. N022]
MKRLLIVLVAAVLLVGVLPVTAFAIEKDDPKFERYLTKIGWKKQDYLDFLRNKGWSLDEFDYLDELGTPLTEKELQSILTEYNITREQLNEWLVEFGQIEKGQDVLDSEYLIFKEWLVEYVDYYMELTPITPENLQELADYYEFGSVEELETFLNGFGESIDDYNYIEDLEESVSYYLYYEETDFDLDGFFAEFGLTEQELERLAAHLESLDYEDPAFEEKLWALSDRMMAIEEFETADEMTAGQIAEILSIFAELLDLFEMDTQYYLVTENEKQSISLETLLTLDTTNGFDLLIEVYNRQGTFLADILLTAEMFGSDIIVDTGEDVKEIEKIISEAPAKKPVKAPLNPGVQDGSKAPVKPEVKGGSKAPVVTSTVKGAKLPKTAGDYVLNTMVGLAFVLIGIVLFRRFKVAGM